MQKMSKFPKKDYGNMKKDIAVIYAVDLPQSIIKIVTPNFIITNEKTNKKLIKN